MICKMSSGKYFTCVLLESEIKLLSESSNIVDGNMGIKDVAIFSYE
ncbi:MAG: hypothetical protein JW702_02040 [Clostridiales bacterium]|nr:hypothetical protein [Clostridiales bacterium]